MKAVIKIIKVTKVIAIYVLIFGVMIYAIGW